MLASVLGFTPIMLAAYNDNIKLIRLLLNYGARANHTTKKGDSALQFTARKHNLAAMELLLKNGADPNIYISGLSLISPEYEALRFTFLVWACKGEFPDIVELLLKYGADPNKTTLYGHPPLMWVLNYHSYCIKKNDKGVEVPDLSDKKKNIKLLLDNGANINFKDCNGNTALIWGAVNSNKTIPEMLGFLIANNKELDINAQNNDGNTALLLAYKEGLTDNVKVLLSHGADLDIENNDGKTIYTIKQEKNARSITSIREILYSEPEKLLKKYAERGNPELQFLLGLAYYRGQGVKKDLRKAEKWLTEAASQNYIEATSLLGELYYKSKKYKEAVKWYKAVAKQGDPESRFYLLYLAIMYYKGWGVKQSYNEAEKWFRKFILNWDKIAKKTECNFSQVLDAFIFMEAFIFYDFDINMDKPPTTVDYKSAEEYLTVLRKVFGDSDDIVVIASLFLGKIYFARKEYFKADKVYKNILGEKEWKYYWWAPALLGCAKCAEAQQDFKKANAYYERINLMYSFETELHSKAYLGRIECLLKMGNKKKAAEVSKEMESDKTIDKFPEIQKAREIMQGKSPDKK